MFSTLFTYLSHGDIKMQFVVHMDFKRLHLEEVRSLLQVGGAVETRNPSISMFHHTHHTRG